MINAKLMNIELTAAFSCNINFAQCNQSDSQDAALPGFTSEQQQTTSRFINRR